MRIPSVGQKGYAFNLDYTKIFEHVYQFNGSWFSKENARSSIRLRFGQVLPPTKQRLIESRREYLRRETLELNKKLAEIQQIHDKLNELEDNLKWDGGNCGSDLPPHSNIK